MLQISGTNSATNSVTNLDKVPMQPEVEISWRDVCGNPFNINLHPAMLTEQGYEVTTSTYLKGTARAGGKTLVKIHFDESYVLAYIQCKIISKCCFTSFQEFNNLMLDAWDYSQNEMQKSN